MHTRPDLVDSPLGDVARRHVLARLRRVMSEVRGTVRPDWRRLRRLLAEAGDHVEAWQTAARAGERTSHLRCSILVSARGEPVTEFLLIPFGNVDVERPLAGESFAFTQAHAESALNWFDQMGRKLAIDYEHQSFDRLNPRPDGLRPAAGWIGRLEIRDDGLWAVDVAWTERALELLRSGEYRYFSPVIFWSDEDHSRLAGLGPVALTNDPAMRGIKALAASRSLDESQPADGAAEEDDDSIADVREHANEAPLEKPGEAALGAALAAAEAEVDVLKRKLAARDADAFIERGMREGKILDSTSMDWRDDYLASAERAEQRLSRAPLLRPPGRVLRVDERGATRRLSAAGGAGVELYRHWNVDSADLQAYERAVASGRVRSSAGGSRN